MTKKQLDSIKFLYDTMKKKGTVDAIVQLKDFKGPMLKAKVQIPWKVVNQYKKECGGFQFRSLYETALGISVESDPSEGPPESFPVQEFADFTKTDRPKKPKKESEAKSSKNPPKKSKEPPAPPSLTAGSKIKAFERPIFLVESVDSASETAVVGITREWDTVWNTLLNRAIHDNGKLSEEKAKHTVDHMGVVIIPSANCSTLFCVVTKMELE